MFTKNCIALAVTLLMLSCQEKSQDCIYLIPKGFQGNVLVLFNQPDGEDVVLENGVRVYKIDSTGILKTKFSENYGSHQSFFFSHDKDGVREKLRYVNLSSEKQTSSSSEVVVFNLETGKDYDYSNSVDRHFEMFTVSSLENMDSIGNLKSNVIWDRLKVK